MFCSFDSCSRIRPTIIRMGIPKKIKLKVDDERRKRM